MFVSGSKNLKFTSDFWSGKSRSRRFTYFECVLARFGGVSFSKVSSSLRFTPVALISSSSVISSSPSSCSDPWKENLPLNFKLRQYLLGKQVQEQDNQVWELFQIQLLQKSCASFASRERSHLLLLVVAWELLGQPSPDVVQRWEYTCYRCNLCIGNSPCVLWARKSPRGFYSEHISVFSLLSQFVDTESKRLRCLSESPRCHHLCSFLKIELSSGFLIYLVSYNKHLFSPVDNQENGGAVSGALRCAKKAPKAWTSITYVVFFEDRSKEMPSVILQIRIASTWFTTCSHSTFKRFSFSILMFHGKSPKKLCSE